MKNQIMTKFVRGLHSNKLSMNLQLFSEGGSDTGGREGPKILTMKQLLLKANLI